MKFAMCGPVALVCRLSLRLCTLLILGTALDRASLMPNTYTMQEIIRSAAENYLENKENGISIEPPFIFTIPKGLHTSRWRDIC